MNFRQTALLIVLALLPASRASAQDGRELYHAEVCNEGRITVDVAVAYKDFDFSTDGFWIVDYWYDVPAGECKVVFSHFYAPNNLLSFQSFPLHLAFAFTDSTGTWGAAKVRPPGRIAASSVKLCVSKKSDEYRVDGKTPQASNCPSGLLIPASIDWEPTQGAQYQQYAGYGDPMTFTVALGPNDRAIPLGAKGSTTLSSQGTGTIVDFGPVLGDIVRSSSGRSNSTWSACIEPMVVEAQSWKNASAARLKLLRDPVIRFLSIHKAGNVRFNIAERAGIIVVEENNKGDCATGLYGVN